MIMDFIIARGHIQIQYFFATFYYGKICIITDTDTNSIWWPKFEPTTNIDTLDISQINLKKQNIFF